MTKKLFTGTLNHNQNKTKNKLYVFTLSVATATASVDTILFCVHVYINNYNFQCDYPLLATATVSIYTMKFGQPNKSNRKAMNRNWSNQKANPALKTKREINKTIILNCLH